ncbi:MAG: hypothetical protein ABGY72_01825 [bacterium]
MSTRTLYIKDPGLWQRAATLVGQGGMSGVIADLLARWVTAQEKAQTRRQEATETVLWVGGPANDREHSPAEYRVAFLGRLVGDSEGHSVTQIPRVHVYQIESGRLVVYRTWLETQDPDRGATYEVFPDFESLCRNPQALDTRWVTGDPNDDTDADFTRALQREIADTLATDLTVRLD